MFEQGAVILNASSMLLKLLRVLNIIAGILLVLLIPVSFVVEERLLGNLAERPWGDPATILAFLRLRVVLLILITPLAHIIFSRLLDMIATVRAGQPFVSENAGRLTTIAWAMLGVQLLDLPGAFSVLLPAAREIRWSPSVTGWLAVLLLFVLARVFGEGARMHEDLEGTV